MHEKCCLQNGGHFVQVAKCSTMVHLVEIEEMMTKFYNVGLIKNK